MSILDIKNLKYSNLFSDLNLQIFNNEFISLSGANNCGKTTLLRILSAQISSTFDIKVFEKNINDYKIEEFSKIVQIVIPEEISFYENNLYEEVSMYINGNSKLLDYIIKGLKIKKLLDKDIDTLTKKEIILAQICLALAMQPKILLLDDLSPFFNNKELESIILFLKDYQKENNITIIYATINLYETLKTDRLIIINDGIIELDDKPITILQKDNIINKLGLNIPFMIDLSVKLRDYDLISEIEMDKDRMVDILWK